MLNSFFKIAGHNNIPGYYDFAFIPDTDILHLPDVVNGSINMDEAVLATDKIFYSGYATLNTLNLGDEAKITNHGQTSPVELSGSTPLVNNTNLQLFSEMARMRYVLLCRDNNNRWYVAGEPGNGLVFEFKRTGAALVFSFKGNYDHVCWEVSGNVLVDGTIIDTGDVPTSPGGGGGTGGDVVIKKTGGAVIATITAPDEYTVADSTVNIKRSDDTLITAKTVKAASTADSTVADTVVNVKDTAGNLLSTQNIKAASTDVDLPAPDAAVTLNGAAWLAPRSGQTVAATLKNEIGADVTPTITGADLVINNNAVLAAYINGDI